MLTALRTDRFRRGLLVVLVVAALLRVVYVLGVTRHDEHLYDAVYYELQARAIADGEGFFQDPFQHRSGNGLELEAADHPPLTVFALLPAAYLGGSELAMRFTMVAFGVGTVAVVALLARRLAGDTAGLVAGAIAAVDPNLWVNDGLLMSEAPGALIAAGLLLTTYTILRDGPRARLLVLAGLLAGLGVLCRAEFALLGLALFVPALWVGGGRVWRPAISGALVVAAAGVVVLGPWVAFNMARFEEPTFVSTNDGLALRAANCDWTFHGSNIGWANVFPPCAEYAPDEEQSVMSARHREAALDYLRDNAERIPVVALARLGRTWNVFNINQTMAFATGEGRPVWVSWLGAISSWLLLPLAVGGAVALRRAGGRAWPLVTVIVIVNAVLALWAGGLLRYRASAEPAMVVLAAVALTTWLSRSRGAPVRRPSS